MKKDTLRHFTQGQIESISKIIGDTSHGLTGSQINHFLKSSGTEDIDPDNTKWKRLFNAFIAVHNKVGSDNHILGFISKALEPSRFVGDHERYEYIIEQINVILSFQGLQFKDNGKFHKVKKASSLSEAEKRVESLKASIKERNLHPELLNYCKLELLTDNYFHAVLESMKGLASIIRKKTGLVNDGADLVDNAYGGRSPILCINNYSTDTEKSEQKGFVNLLKGSFGTFRNPVAHAPRIEWDINEQDALDLFTMTSYLYRRVEKSYKRDEK